MIAFESTFLVVSNAIEFGIINETNTMEPNNELNHTTPARRLCSLNELLVKEEKNLCCPKVYSLTNSLLIP